MNKLLYILLLSLPFLSVSQVNQKDAKGRKQGVWQKQYPKSSTFIYKGQFIDDQAVGSFYYYYQSGKIKSVIEHLPNSNQRSFVVFYFEDGSVLSEGMYKNQLKDSVWFNYNSSGALSSKENYKQNRLNGEKIIYYTEGQIENKTLIPLSIANYFKDEINGIYSEFFTTGKPKIRGSYVNGFRDGEWFIYHPNGQIEKKVSYRKDLEHAWAYTYDKNGVKLSEVFYQNGNILRGKELDVFLKKCSDNGINPGD
jgi:antitoxin component YwqK of YwqJK toxin-antitoxin module